MLSRSAVSSAFATSSRSHQNRRHRILLPRHFADKEALLAAVAEYGFRELAARLTAAAATAADPRAGLAALGVAYVLFARDHPSLFKLMFGPTVEKKTGHPAFGRAGGGLFNGLWEAGGGAKFLRR